MQEKKNSKDCFDSTMRNANGKSGSDIKVLTGTFWS